AKLPTLIVNGSGAYLFSGMILGDEDIEPMLPYVEQGFAILAYETDGCQPDFERDPTMLDIAQMTRQYVKSKAGLINAKRAMSFALERFPELDSDQLYTIGHSSGGKQALLLASHDDRIRGCVAFAPACEMEFGSAMTVARIRGVDTFRLGQEVKRSMPLVHAERLTVPTLLIYSRRDRITTPNEVLRYAHAVGSNARAVQVNCDGHGYVPDAGEELALKWLSIHVEDTRTKEGATSGAMTTLVSDQPAAAAPTPAASNVIDATSAPASDAASWAARESTPASPPIPSTPTPPRQLPSFPQQVQEPQGMRKNPFAP
ncbi:MAG: prolyl oligopeptidase family serine peptidase, partial [Planctomycetota bacterium]